MRYLFVFSFFFAIQFCATKHIVAQDKIIFLDGQILDCKVLGFNDTISHIEKGKRKKEIIIDNSDVFSIKIGDTLEFIIYQADISKQRTFSEHQMMRYVQGAIYAHEHYCPFWVGVGGVITGAGGGLIGFYGLLIPAAYDITMGAVYTFPKPKKKQPSLLLKDEYFVMGYQSVAQKKKVKTAIITSLTGLVAIVTYSYIMLHED